METIPAILEQRLHAALNNPEAPVRVQTVTDSRFGDYQTNIAMLLAKKPANPRQFAQELISRLEVSDICAPPEIAGPGFINFRLKPEWLAERFPSLASDERLGVPEPAKRLKIVIDFSSPNVAKPMHVGHIRSTILGDSLARIAAFIGHEVIRDNHIGDWGTQFGMLIIGWKTELDPSALETDPLAELERIYRLVSPKCDSAKPQFDPAVREKARRELVALQSGDPENLAIWREMIRLSQTQFEEIYGRLGVKFDVMLGESFYNPWLKSVVEDLVSKGIARESEGATCVFSDGTLPPEKDPFFITDKEGLRANPAIIMKADGGANYTTTDLATIQYRLGRWAPDQILYVTDGRQQLHFRQLFAIVQRWMPEVQAKLAHVWFGTILGADGKPLKTRDGENIKLKELLDEAEERAAAVVAEKDPDLSPEQRREVSRVIGLGAVKYSDLLPNRQGDYLFSWEKMLALNGNTAPYLQNSYVRTCGILRKAGESVSERPAVMLFPEKGDLALVKKLFQFGEVIPQVLDDYRPNLLCNYLFELAASFHSFFEACPVLTAPSPELRATRLELCRVTGRVLKCGLGLLGIDAPERM